MASQLSVGKHNSFAKMSTVQSVTQVQEPCNWNVESRATDGIDLAAAVASVVRVLVTRSEFDIESDVMVCS